MSENVKIIVPSLHYDDFVNHPGWWCVPYNPRVQAGDTVEFELTGGPVAYLKRLEATVKGCRYVTSKDPNEDAARGFDGWYVIEYEGWFPSEDPANNPGTGEKWNADIAEALENVNPQPAHRTA